MNRRVNSSKSPHRGDLPVHSSQTDNSPPNRSQGQSPTKRSGTIGRKRPASPLLPDDTDVHSDSSRNITQKGGKKNRPYRKESSSNHNWESSPSPNGDATAPEAQRKEAELADLETAGPIRMDPAEMKKITVKINRPQSKLPFFSNPELITPVRRSDEGKHPIFDRPEIKEANAKRLKMAESRSKPEAGSSREKPPRDSERDAPSARNSSRRSHSRSISPKQRKCASEERSEKEEKFYKSKRIRHDKYERGNDRRDDRMRRSPHHSSAVRRARSADRERRDRDRRSGERRSAGRSRERRSSERPSRRDKEDQAEEESDSHNPPGNDGMMRPRMRAPYPMVPMRPMGPYVPLHYPPMFFPHPVPFPPRRPPRGYYPPH